MSSQPQLDFTSHAILVMAADPCEKRHRGNENSVAAHEKILLYKPEKYDRILTFVKERGGATVHEIAIALGYGPAINRVSGRLSELRYMQPPRLKDSGMRRGGAAVLELV